MRALVLAEFNRMALAEVPDPAVADDDVLIKVEAVGICGTDVHGFTGANGRRVPGQIMGHEAAGTVLHSPSDDLAVGQPVTFDPLLPCRTCEPCRQGEQQHCADRKVIGVDPEIRAAFAELIAVPLSNVVALPDGFGTDNGALIEPLAVAFHAVRRSRIGPDDRVLVIGGGPIGQSLVLAAGTRTDKQVVVSEPDPGRRALCASLGAVVIDPTAGDLADQLTGLTGSTVGPVDVTIDAVGLSRSMADALAATRAGGSVTLVGMGTPTLELPSFAVSTAERSVIGSFCYSDDDFRTAAGWAGEHARDLAPLISKRVALAEAPQAFTDLAGSAPAAGKVIVQPQR